MTMNTQPKPRYFYKYVTAKVAKLILATRNVRYSSPILFNDPFDTQIDLHFPFEISELQQPIIEKLLKIVNSDEPVANPLLHPYLIVLELLRQSRDQLKLTREGLIGDVLPAIEQGINDLYKSLPETHLHLRNEFLNKAMVFCVTEIHDNILMWSHYADHHKGAVIKFRCMPEIDNMLCAATPIAYQQDMPILATIDEWLDSAFGFTQLDYRKMWDRMFSVKSAAWQYEKEWRVIVPDLNPGHLYADMKIHAQEVESVIFGCRMTDEDKCEILALLNSDLGHVSVFEANKNAKKFLLDFVCIRT